MAPFLLEKEGLTKTEQDSYNQEHHLILRGKNGG